MDNVEKNESLSAEVYDTKIKKRKRADKQLKKMRKKRYIIETICTIVIATVMLVLITNKTFFREEYRTDNIKIDLPLLTFFVSDNNNEVKLLTLRKSGYVKEYFDEYLSLLDRYSCKDKIFYYDEKHNTAIYEINVEKGFALKTITIKYNNGDANSLCEEWASFLGCGMDKKDLENLLKYTNDIVDKYRKYSLVECIYLYENVIDEIRTFNIVVVERNNEKIEKYINYDNNMIRNIDLVTFGVRVNIFYDKCYYMYFKNDENREICLKNGVILYDKTGLYNKLKDNLLTSKSQKQKKL